MTRRVYPVTATLINGVAQHYFRQIVTQISQLVAAGMDVTPGLGARKPTATILPCLFRSNPSCDNRL